jgi:adenylate cyclase
MIAEAHHDAGDTGAGLAILDGALSLSRDYGQPYWDAELMRLKGEFMLALDPDAGAPAEAIMREALADARSRGAASLALRAASSLARRLRASGHGAEAGRELAAAVAAIDGGGDTPDVRDARALLEDLSVDTLEAKES